MRFLIPLCGLLAAASAAEPVLTHVHPAGIQRGTEADVKLTGKFEPWPCKVWADDPGIVFTPDKEKGKLHVTVATAVRPGPHLIRAFNAEGSSAPISMVVAESPQTQETEPNDDFRMPQVLSGTTATCNGRLDKSDDVDSFAVTLKKGQVMVAWVEACVLASGFDAMLRVLDDRGTTLAFNHDYTTMDPFIVFTAPQDGRYIVQTMGHNYPASTDIRFAGGDTCVYRLHLSTEPLVRNTWPLAVTRGKRTKVALEGWNLAVTQLEIDDSVPHSFPVTFSDVPEIVESPGARNLEIPCAVSGRLEHPGEEDRFTFTAAKNTELELTVTGSEYGSLIDPWLKVQRSDSKIVESKDDSGSSLDPRIRWAPGADGTFTAIVGDVAHRGGGEIYYRLLVNKPAPAVAASIADHSIKMETGKSTELKVKVSPTNGYRSKLKLAALNLPPGITATEMDVPEKGGEVVFKLNATQPSPASAPFRLTLREVEGGKEIPVLYSIASTGENNGVPQGFGRLLLNQTDQLWLTVTAPPPAAAPAPAKK